MKILLLSDTHGYLDEPVLKHVSEADQVWHAGDFGSLEVSNKLSSLKPLKGVYGNIDGQDIRKILPLHNRFSCEGFNILITHIGGYPGKYDPKIREIIQKNPPDIFICGHSHILKIIKDNNFNLLFINPGAAGKEGFHKVRTLVKFTLKNKQVSDMQVIELGGR
ncbi:MAG: metallophosphoesterase family protein [Bacteroidota bacterium]